MFPISRQHLPLPRDLDDAYSFLTRRSPEQALIMAAMARGTAAASFPYAPPQTMPRRTIRPRRRLPTRRSWREQWWMAYTTPVSKSPGNAVSSTDYNAAAVNDVLYLLSGQPLISVFYQPNANYTLALSAAQAAFSKIEGAGTNIRNSITINGSRIMGYFLGFIGYDSTSHNSDAEFNAILDGATNVFNTHYIAAQQAVSGGPTGSPFTIPYFFTGLATGAHTLDPGWRSDWSQGAGTTTLTAYSKTNYGGIAHVCWEM